MAKKRKLKQNLEALWVRVQESESQLARYERWLKSVEKQRDSYEEKWLELLKKHEPAEYDRIMFERYVRQHLFEDLIKLEDAALLYGTTGNSGPDLQGIAFHQDPNPPGPPGSWGCG